MGERETARGNHLKETRRAAVWDGLCNLHNVRRSLVAHDYNGRRRGVIREGGHTSKTKSYR